MAMVRRKQKALHQTLGPIDEQQVLYTRYCAHHRGGPCCMHSSMSVMSLISIVVLVKQ
jgi:hypothetical protein